MSGCYSISNIGTSVTNLRSYHCDFTIVTIWLLLNKGASWNKQSVIGRLFGADNRPKHYRCTSSIRCWHWYASANVVWPGAFCVWVHPECCWCSMLSITRHNFTEPSASMHSHKGWLHQILVSKDRGPSGRRHTELNAVHQVLNV